MSEVDQSCQLVGVVGIIVQLVLGALSFSVLIYKRYRENPKRAWKIWALDTSKQGTSQMFAHFINLAISMQLSNKLQGDACLWYLTTNILDNSLGVLLCLAVLQLVESTFFKGPYARFQSGNYYQQLQEYDDEKSSGMDSGQGYKPLEIGRRKVRVSYFDWLVQFVVWNTIVIVSKTLLFELQYLLNVPLTAVANFLIGWLKPYQTLELILVIIIVPVIMNGFAFWMQDNFLKKKDTTTTKTEAMIIRNRPSESTHTSDNENIRPSDNNQPLLL